MAASSAFLGGMLECPAPIVIRPLRLCALCALGALGALGAHGAHGRAASLPALLRPARRKARLLP
jgi:hypothetical protein